MNVTWLMRTSRGQVLRTSASAVAAINAIIGGAGVTLLLTSAGLARGTGATIAGVVAALVCFAAHTAFQTSQFRRVLPRGEGAQDTDRERLPV